MIVKLQISLNDGGKHLLVYNQDRSVMCHFDTDPEIRALMNGEPKRYFHASVNDDTLTIEDRTPAPDQDW